jgi:hypothetical protein
MNDQNLCKFITFLNRAPGLWFLIGESLKHWVTHRQLKEPVEVAVTCSKEDLEKYCYDRNFNFEYDKCVLHGIHARIKFNVPINHKTVASEEDRQRLKRRRDMTAYGVWRRNIKPTEPLSVQLPFKYGTILDEWRRGWWIDQEHNINDIPPNKSVWFTPERKRNAYELLRLMYECADRAGMRHALFIGFGTLLGYVKFGDVIPYDNDMDMCVMSNLTTPENIKKFVAEIQKPFKIGKQNFPHGLGESMFRFSNNCNLGYPVWLSVGHRSIMRDNGVKSCIWVMFKHSNYYFHSKGDRWVTSAKFPSFQIRRQDVALALGQPEWTISTGQRPGKDFIEIDFHGVKVNAPVNAGSCCDWWYDGFSYFGEGASAHKRILAIENWEDRSTWRMA